MVKTKMAVYPVFAKVIFHDFDENTKSEDIWFFAESYAVAAKHIEDYYRNDLICFSMYMFEEDSIFRNSDLPHMLAEAKQALNIS